MWKRLLVVSAVSAAMSSMALAAPLTVGFSQVGSESGWRAGIKRGERCRNPGLLA